MWMRLSERIRVVVILALGIMAIGLLTWGLGKLYIELVGQSSREHGVAVQNRTNDANPLTDTVLNLPELTFWTCQVGVFQSESNAQSRSEQLRVLNLQAGVISPSSGPKIVGIGFGRSTEELKGLRQALADQGIPTIPKQVVLPARAFRVAGNGTQLTVELLTNVNTILQEGFTEVALVKEEQAWISLAGEHPPKQLVGLHELYGKAREKTTQEEQKVFSFALFLEYQKVINNLSGK